MSALIILVAGSVGVCMPLIFAPAIVTSLRGYELSLLFLVVDEQMV